MALWRTFSLKALLAAVGAVVVVGGVLAERRWQQDVAISRVEALGCRVVRGRNLVSRWTGIAFHWPFSEAVFVRCPATFDDVRVTELVPELNGIRYVTAIELVGSDIGNASLRALVNVPSLTGVYVAGTSATDDGIAALAELADLEALDVSNTAATDAVLPSLAKLRRLRLLHYEGSQITADGEARLRESHPGLNFPAMN